MMMTKHFQEDRADRYAFIATTIGIGKVVHSKTYEFDYVHNRAGSTINITNPGVAMIIAPDGTLITMYVLTLSEARRYFIDKTVPMVLAAIIKKNMKNQYHILQNEVKY